MYYYTASKFNSKQLVKNVCIVFPCNFTNRVFIKYCVISKIYSGLWPLSVSPRCQCVCTQWQVKHQRCRRTYKVQKNHNILSKNTIFNEHPATINASSRDLAIEKQDGNVELHF